MGEPHENGWQEYKRAVLGDIERFEKKLDQLINDVNQVKTAVALLQLKAALFGALAGAVLSLAGEILFRVHL